jgi:hypothetical protein
VSKREEGMKVNQEFLTLVLLGQGTTHSHTPGAPAPATLPHNKSPFEYLHTEEGFLHAKTYFSFIANNNDETDEYFNENQFINFLRKLTDFNDHEILEIYDTFGNPPPHNFNNLAHRPVSPPRSTTDVRLGEASGIRFEEYFCILSLLGSRDHGQLTKSLYVRTLPYVAAAEHHCSASCTLTPGSAVVRFLHGESMFNILVNKLTGEVIYDKFRRLGFLLGIPETYILGNDRQCWCGGHSPVTILMHSSL